jgi:hypothetical protein
MMSRVKSRTFPTTTATTTAVVRCSKASLADYFEAMSGEGFILDRSDPAAGADAFVRLVVLPILTGVGHGAGAGCADTASITQSELCRLQVSPQEVRGPLPCRAVLRCAVPCLGGKAGSRACTQCRHA